MRLRIPSAAKALFVLTAAGLLLSGCYYHHRSTYGGPHYVSPGYGYKHHYSGKGRKQGTGTTPTIMVIAATTSRGEAVGAGRARHLAIAVGVTAAVRRGRRWHAGPGAPSPSFAHGSARSAARGEVKLALLAKASQPSLARREGF